MHAAMFYPLLSLLHFPIGAGLLGIYNTDQNKNKKNADKTEKMSNEENSIKYITMMMMMVRMTVAMAAVGRWKQLVGRKSY